MHSPIGKGFDALADGWPDKAEDSAGQDDRECGDDWHRAFASKETKVAWQLYAIEAIECCRGDQSDDDTAEHTGLDRRNTHDRGGRNAAQFRADAHCREEHDEADGPGEGRDAIIIRESYG